MERGHCYKTLKGWVINITFLRIKNVVSPSSALSNLKPFPLKLSSNDSLTLVLCNRCATLSMSASAIVLSLKETSTRLQFKSTGSTALFHNGVAKHLRLGKSWEGQSAPIDMKWVHIDYLLCKQNERNVTCYIQG